MVKRCDELCRVYRPPFLNYVVSHSASRRTVNEVMYKEFGGFICRGIMVACCDQLHQFIAYISCQMEPVYITLTFSFEIK